MTESLTARVSDGGVEQSVDGMSVAQWQCSMHEWIREIGKQEPKKAERISRMVQAYRGTADERAILLENGVVVPVVLTRPGLRGGMVEEGGTIAFQLLKGLVKLAIEGNKKDVEKRLEQSQVEAEMKLPSGDKIKGHHEGSRIVTGPHKSFKVLRKYCLVPSGYGIFRSERVRYEGEFFNGEFHDLTGNAVYYIERSQKYEGCFEKGKRAGRGIQYTYDPQTQGYLKSFEGEWDNDAPFSGKLYAADGHTVIATIRNGRRVDGGTKNAAAQRQVPNPLPQSAAPPPPKADYADDESPYATLSGDRLPRIDPKVPPEQAFPLIARKLANPERELPLDESIDLLVTCVRYGHHRAQQMQGKTATIVIGNTGAGKSTFANAVLAQCSMEEKFPKDLGLKGVKKLIVVKPKNKGGARDEVMPIGHTKESKTFMPQIETVESHTVCDCPGFLDNRGAEINIANAVNIRAAITQADGVKVIILINYHSLQADRGRGLTDMLKICTDLFGDVATIKKHSKSIMLGVTNIPHDMNLNDLKEWVVEGTPEVMQTLVKRLFIYDPLNRLTGDGGWSTDRCRREIEGLSTIDNPSTIFRTVLTPADEKRLIEIAKGIEKSIAGYLRKDDAINAATYFRHLSRLSVIDHIVVERLLRQTYLNVGRYYQKMVITFKDHCTFERFSEARPLLDKIEKAYQAFGSQFEEIVDLQELKGFFSAAEVRRDSRLAKEAAVQRQLESAQVRIEELIRSLDEQKRATEEQIRAQKENYEATQRDMRQQMEQVQDSYSKMQADLRAEMDERLTKKDAEMRRAQELNQTELRQTLAAEQAELQREYEEKLRETRAEQEKQLAENQALLAQTEQQMKEERAKLQQKLTSIETERSAKAEELAATETAAKLSDEERTELERMLKQFDSFLYTNDQALATEKELLTKSLEDLYKQRPPQAEFAAEKERLIRHHRTNINRLEKERRRLETAKQGIMEDLGLKPDQPFTASTTNIDEELAAIASRVAQRRISDSVRTDTTISMPPITHQQADCCTDEECRKCAAVFIVVLVFGAIITTAIALSVNSDNSA